MNNKLPLSLTQELSSWQVHPHRCFGQRVSRRSRARGGAHGPGPAAGRLAVELPGSRSAGRTLRPGGQPAQPGLHGVHLTGVWRCHSGGSGLPQLGKKTTTLRDRAISSLLYYLFVKLLIVWTMYKALSMPQSFVQSNAAKWKEYNSNPSLPRHCLPPTQEPIDPLYFWWSSTNLGEYTENIKPIYRDSLTQNTKIKLVLHKTKTAHQSDSAHATPKVKHGSFMFHQWVGSGFL